ncbi:hypothetical protein S83_032826 [Arachis hypogaea]
MCSHSPNILSSSCIYMLIYSNGIYSCTLNLKSAVLTRVAIWIMFFLPNKMRPSYCFTLLLIPMFSSKVDICCVRVYMMCFTSRSGIMEEDLPTTKKNGLAV